MSVQLSMFSPATLKDSLNATSSLESVFGPTLSDKLDGQMTSQSGPEVVPASPSPLREPEKDSMTSAIYGLSSSGSSASADLTQSLANRLRVKTHSLGSTLFRLTWKERTTPSGRSIPALRASVLRTSDRDSGGWPTPVANDDNKSVEAHLAMKQRMGERDGTGANRTAITSLQVTAKLAAWPTPQTHDDRKRGNTEADHHYSPHDLPNMAELASWPTPNHNGTGAGTQGREGGANLQTAASWATPTQRDHKDGSSVGTAPTNCLLGRQVWMAHWNSPRGSAEKMGRPREKDWGDLQAQATGAIAIGSPASTEKPGQLNPEHSRWLMGLPTEWGRCAAMVTRSSRRKPKRL